MKYQDKAYNPWIKDDDDKLRHLVCSRQTIKEMAEFFRRTEGAIQSRIKRLGLNHKAPEHIQPEPKQNRTDNIKPVRTMNISIKLKDLFNHPNHGRVRKHFKTGLEISEDGEFVQKSYSDSHTGETKYFSPDIHQDSDGREYVNWSDKKVYIDEMVCTCFHGSPKEGQSVVHIDGRMGNSKASNLKWS